MPVAVASPPRRSCVLWVVLAGACAWGAPAAAGGFVVSGHGGSLYDGGELDDLLQSVATIAYVLLVAGDDDRDLWCGDAPYARHGHHHDRVGCDDLGLRVPQLQVSAGLGYTLSRRLTVGARYLYRHDRRDHAIARLWGGGPEVTLDLADGPVRPFVAASWLFTRGQHRADGVPLRHGTSLGARAGVRWRVAPGVSLLVQAGLQDDRFVEPFAAPLLSRGATLGTGLRLDLE